MDDKESPEHVEHMADGGAVCRACGGMVGKDGRAAQGYADGGEVEYETDSDIPPEIEGRDGVSFANAVAGRIRRWPSGVSNQTPQSEGGPTGFFKRGK